MSLAPATLPNDVAALQGLVIAYHDKWNSAENYLKLAEEKVRLLKAMLFGRKSEKQTAEEDEQGRLFNEIEGVLSKPAATVRSHRRGKGGRKPLPADLPREIITHDLPEDEKQCGCGAPLVRIGEERTEKVDVVPQRVVVQVHVRPKYACHVCEGSGDETHPGVRVAPLPEQMVPKSIATARLLAFIFASKFVDALPFYRLSKIFARFGFELSRTRMCQWAMHVHRRCLPLLQLLRRDLLSGPLVGADETPVQVLGEKDRSNTAKSQMWVVRGGDVGRPVVWFEYRPTRSGSVIEEILAGYQGYLQTDGYSGYDRVGEWPGVNHVGCWAHARRGFVAVQKAAAKSPVADDAVEFIGKLYEIEAKARQQKIDAIALRELRQKEARPVLDALHKWLKEKSPEVPPKSLLGEAIAYTLDRWPKLIRYLDDGRIPIDNNLVENAIRPFVIGRKNWLFSACPQGAAASAALYTLVENAKANGLDPYWYFCHLFEKLPNVKDNNEAELRALLPQYVEKSLVKALAAAA